MPECTTTGFNKFYCGSLRISFLYIMVNCCLFWLIFLYENVAVQLLYYTYENKIQNWKNWKKFQYLWILTGTSTGVYSGEVHDWQQKKLHHSQSVRPDSLEPAYKEGIVPSRKYKVCYYLTLFTYLYELTFNYHEHNSIERCIVLSILKVHFFDLWIWMKLQ